MFKPKKKGPKVSDHNEPMSDLGSDVCKAAFFGNLSFLEAILTMEEVDKDNLKDTYGDTPLHRAVYSGQLKCVYYLLECKVDVNASGANGMTPLHSAADSIKCIEPNVKQDLTASKIQDLIIEVTSLLVARGAKLTRVDGDNRTPIDVARENKLPDLVEIMERLRVDQEMQEQQLRHKQKLEDLLKACLEGDLKTVEAILDEAPSIIDEVLPNDDPVLVAAARSGSVGLVCFLAGRDARNLLNPVRKETALHVAVRAGNKAMVVELLKCLPQLLVCDDTGDATSLHIAAAEGHVEIAEIFLELVEQNRTYVESCTEEGLALSSQPDTLTPKSSGGSGNPRGEEEPKDDTDSEDSLDIETASRSIDPFQRTSRDGNTPLHLAIDNDHLPILRLYCDLVNRLIEVCPDAKPELLKRLQIRNKRGFNPFHRAANNGNILAMGMLLDMCVNINAFIEPPSMGTSGPKYTALGIAGVAGKFEVVEFLLRAGAKDPENKALRRTLRIDNPEQLRCSGLMLWYNEYVSILPHSKDPEIPLHQGRKPDACVMLSWGNNELTEVCPPWLTLPASSTLDPKSLVSITSIELMSNFLTELPMELFKLPYLTRIDISKNKIGFLPTQGELGWDCTGLYELKMSHNEIRNIPAGVFKLLNLNELDASHNNISSVPPDMWLAPKLRTLKLNHNRLVQLPFPNPLDSFVSSSRRLTLSSNSDSQSEGSFGTRFTHTVNESLSQSSMKKPQKLTRKRVSMVQAKEGFNKRYGLLNDGEGFEAEELVEEADTMSPLDDSASTSRLEALYLQHNQLPEVPRGLCCLAPRLHRLTLAHNQITSLGHINDYPADLDSLDVQNNNLKRDILPSIGSQEPFYMRVNGLPVSFCPRWYLLEGEKFLGSLSRSCCSHRTHRQLRRLSSYRLNNNMLKAVELFTESPRRAFSTSDRAPDTRSPSQSSVTVTSPLPTKGSGGQRRATDQSQHKPLSAKRSSSSGNASGLDDDERDISTETITVPLFPTLNTLEVAANKLSSVPTNIHLLYSLGSLDISNNEDITALPLEMGRLENMFFFMHNNVPLKYPNPAALESCKDTPSKMFYLRTLLEDAQPNTSLKLMLVGYQKQGKTTLLSHLTEVNELPTPSSTFTTRTFDDSPQKPVKQVSGEHLSTVGVDLGVWKYSIDKEPSQPKPVRGAPKKEYKSVTFYTWDFGGQEEYYTTHQLFLSARSLYLVIFNMTKGEKGIQDLALWLHNIEARAPHSPVIIVATHLDHYRDPQEKTAQTEKCRARIKEMYEGNHRAGQFSRTDPGLPVIKGVMFVGLPGVKDGRERKPEGVAQLRRFIYNTAWGLRVSSGNRAQSKLSLLEQPVPASYPKLEYRVRELSAQCKADQTPPVLQEAAFREAVKDVIEDKRELNLAVNFLHENGVLLHYDTPALNQLYFVNPQWLCDMLAHVITVPEVNGWIGVKSGLNSGILKKTSLQQVFKGQVFPIQFQKEYIELLNRFEVAIQVDSSHLLVPSALSAKPNYTVSYQSTLFPRPSLQQIRDSLPLCDRDNSPTYPHFTKLLLRRFYFMPHLPSGFWPRLTSRFLTDNAFYSIVLGNLGYGSSDIDQMVKNKSRSSQQSEFSWTYWKTGVELWCQNVSILRVTEILHEGALRHCISTPSPLVSTQTEAIDPAKDSAFLLFDLQGQCHPVDLVGAPKGLEIIVSDCISRTVLDAAIQTLEQSETCSITSSVERRRASSTSSTAPVASNCNAVEEGWMGAQLLAYVVEVLDLLLEDWFPGIGSRDRTLNRYDIPYINRIVPCPFCVNHASPCPVPAELEASTTSQDTLIDSSTSHTSQKKSKLAFLKKSIRPLFKEDHTSNKLKSSLASVTENSENRPKESLPLLPDVQEHSFTSSNDSGSDNTGGEVLTTEDSLVSQASGTDFFKVNRFGFMVDSIICAARQGKSTMDCPVHKELEIRDLAPDLMFADFQKHHLEESQLIFGSFVGNGSFGDIYQGTVLPFSGASDAHGFPVAIKICTSESPRRKALQKGKVLQEDPNDSAIKTYNEVRAEASLLRELVHPHLIEFKGLCLNPMCIALEWAPKKSLKSILNNYKKSRAQLSPQALQETARQIASGLAYLHSKDTTHFDMKADNVLAFSFPSAQYSLEKTTPGATNLTQLGAFSSPYRNQQNADYNPEEILVKITDFGISRQSSLGYYKGQRGTSGFMAPEILKYSGKEAVHSKVDIYSFAMVMYEMISLFCPFEQEALHQQQIDKLTIDKTRPNLGSKELNNPLLFLEVMQWCWDDSYLARPSAELVRDLLANPAVPHLMEMIELGPLNEITTACISSMLINTQPENIERSSTSSMLFSGEFGDFGDSQQQQFLEATGTSPLAPPSLRHSSVVFGDMYQELWLASFDPERSPAAGLHVVSFQGRTKHFVQSWRLCRAPVSAMCAVSGGLSRLTHIWVGNTHGELFVFEATSRTLVFDRQLALKADSQGIVSIMHVPNLSAHAVIVIRKDGHILLFDDEISVHQLPDDREFDHCHLTTLLPVKSVTRTRNNAPVYCATMKRTLSHKFEIVCGCLDASVQLFSFSYGRIEYSSTMSYGSFPQPMKTRSEDVYVSQLVSGRENGRDTLWGLVKPEGMLMCWDGVGKQAIRQLMCKNFTGYQVDSIQVVNSRLYLSTLAGRVISIDINSRRYDELHGHYGAVNTIVPLGARTLPRQWLPSIIGRVNAKDVISSELSEENIRKMKESMVGEARDVVVSIGKGFYGFGSANPLSSANEHHNSFLLMWTE